MRASVRTRSVAEHGRDRIHVGVPRTGADGDGWLGGYTHVVDGAGQSRAVPDVDRSRDWSQGDAFNFWLFGEFVPTAVAGEVLGGLVALASEVRAGTALGGRLSTRTRPLGS